MKYLLFPLFFYLTIISNIYCIETNYVFDDFEIQSWGIKWATINMSKRAEPYMIYITSPVYSGKYACKVIVPPGETLTILTQHTKEFIPNGKKPYISLVGNPTGIGLWVYGDSGEQKIGITIYDKTKKSYELQLGTINFTGWKYVYTKVPALEQPVQLSAITFSGGKKGTDIIFDDLTIETSVDNQNLYFDAEQIEPLNEKVEGEEVSIRLKLQSLNGPQNGQIRWSLLETSDNKVIDTGNLEFKCSPKQPFIKNLIFKLDSGVYILKLRAGEIKKEVEFHIFPKKEKAVRTDSIKKIKKFINEKSEMIVFNNDLVPYLLLYSKSSELLLFNGLSVNELQIHSKLPSEPFFLVWFNRMKSWKEIVFNNNSTIEQFDVPLLVSLQHNPKEFQVTEKGLKLKFTDECGYVWMMPLYGIRRFNLETTKKWGENNDPEFNKIINDCRFWIQAMRAVPVSVYEDYKIDTTNDIVTIKDTFEFMHITDDWSTKEILACPIEPLVILASDSGMPINFSDLPEDTGCLTSIGPYKIIRNKNSYYYTLEGFLKYIIQTRTNLKEDNVEFKVNLNRDYWWVCHESAQILNLGKLSSKLTIEDKKYAQNGINVLLAYMTNPDNLWFTYDKLKGHMYIHDGLNWSRMQWTDSNAVSAEHIRALYYAGIYAGMTDFIKNHWNHIKSLNNVYTDWTSWGTSAFNSGGGDTFDSTFNGHISMARLSTLIGDKDIYAYSCYMSIKKFISAVASVKGAPEYLKQFNPPAGYALRINTKEIKEINDIFYTDIYPGSYGFMLWNRPITHRPDEAEYHFADDYLRSFFKKYFQPFKCVFLSTYTVFLGTSFNDWSSYTWENKFLLPVEDKEFRPGIDLTGSKGSNYTFDLPLVEYYPPRIEWQVFKSSITGEPLHFGYFTPDSNRIPINTKTLNVNWVLTLNGCEWTDPILEISELRSLPQLFQGYILKYANKNIKKYVELFKQQGKQSWIFCGPFPMDSCDQFETPHPPEWTVETLPVYRNIVGGKLYVARWRSLNIDNYKIDFNRLYEPNMGNYVHQAVVYVLGYIGSPDKREVNLCIGSDDGVRVWLNDKLVHSNHIHRSCSFDQDIVPVKLEQGWNKLLIKVENRYLGGNWELIFRIADKNLLPYSDLKFVPQL